MSGVTALLLAVGALTVTGCDELGNPAPEVGTPPRRWRGPGVVLETRTRSVPAARSNELLRQIKGHRLEQADAEARPGDEVVLVEVTAAWGMRPTLPRISLITVFRLPDGQEIQRTWTAASDSDVWYAGFALPAAPTDAITVLAP